MNSYPDCVIRFIQDCKSYYHECFLRGRPELTTLMVRLVNPGKRLPDKESEPNFYDTSKILPLPGLPGIDVPIINPPQVKDAGPVLANPGKRSPDEKSKPVPYDTSKMHPLPSLQRINVPTLHPAKIMAVGPYCPEQASERMGEGRTPMPHNGRKALKCAPVFHENPAQAFNAYGGCGQVPMAAQSSHVNPHWQQQQAGGAGFDTVSANPTGLMNLMDPYWNQASGKSPHSTAFKSELLQRQDLQPGMSAAVPATCTSIPVNGAHSTSSLGQVYSCNNSFVPQMDGNPLGADFSASTSDDWVEEAFASNGQQQPGLRKCPSFLSIDDNGGYIEEGDLSLYRVEPDPLDEGRPLKIGNGADVALSNIQGEGDPLITNFADIFFSAHK